MTTPFDRWLTTDPRDTPECPACEGTGCAADTGSGPPLVCPACAGTGAAPHPPEVEPVDTMCEPCAGNGRIEGGETCGSCMGHGSHPVPLHLLGLDQPAAAEPPKPDLDTDDIDIVYETLGNLVEAILGPAASIPGPDPSPNQVLASVLVCSHPEFTSRVPVGWLTGCDGCDRMTIAGPLEDWGLGWVTAYDTDGIPDVAICPVCCLYNVENDPGYYMDDVLDIEELRREEQDAIDSMDGS